MAMINCPECNNTVSDQAAACPRCGYPINAQQTRTAPVVSPQQAPVNQQPYGVPNGYAPQYMQSFGQQRSSLYPQIRAYADAARGIFTLSVIGLVLCMGIGIIFALISQSKRKSLLPIREPIADPYELAEYQAAERKLKTAKTMSDITIIVVAVLFLIGIISSLVIALESY